MAEDKAKGSNGRKQNQKMKPYLTYHILMKKTDTKLRAQRKREEKKAISYAI